MYTAAPGALATIAIGAATPPRLARAAAAAHSRPARPLPAGSAHSRPAHSRPSRAGPLPAGPRCSGRRVRRGDAGRGAGLGRGPTQVYLERRSQRPRGFLFLTAHTSFINRNKFRLIDSPSLVSARGFEETCAAPPARSSGLGSSIRFKETKSSKWRGRALSPPPPPLPRRAA